MHPDVNPKELAGVLFGRKIGRTEEQPNWCPIRAAVKAFLVD